MSYLLGDSTNPFINIKLTEYGRRKLASGQLSYAYYAFGDSEVDYKVNYNNLIPFDITTDSILSPVDQFPKIKSILTPSISGNPSLTPLQSVGGNPVNFRVKEIESKNVAPTRGFFSGTTAYTMYTSTDYMWNYGTASKNTFTGGTSINVTLGSTGYTNLGRGYLLVSYTAPNFTGSTESIGNVPLTQANQYLWYRIEGQTGSYPNYTLTLDRVTPNFNGASANNVRVYVFPSGNSITNYYGSASTTNYWTPGTLDFSLPCLNGVEDVPVWNMNIVRRNSLLGSADYLQEYTQYGSAVYNGTFNYFDYFGVSSVTTTTTIPTNVVFGTNPNNVINPSNNNTITTTSLVPFDTGINALGIIHYTNNSVSNYYGEYLIDNFELNIPTVLWHKETTGKIGLTLTANVSTVANQQTSNNGFNYFDLRDTTTNNSIVGKVYPQLKLALIEDPELLAAMTYKSNRNYTLPAPNVNTWNYGTPSLLNSGERLWVTYQLRNTSAYTSGVTYGYDNTLPCQNVKYVDNLGSTANTFDVAFSLTSDLPFYRNPSELNGTGWNAQQLYVLMQKTTTGSTSPDPKAWKYVDFTSAVTSGSSLTREQLTGSPPTVIITNAVYTGATAYTLSQANDDSVFVPGVNDTTSLKFGDEVFFFGNVDTDFAAKIFRTTFYCRAPIGKFTNSPDNPTKIQGKTFVTEAAIYDSTLNVVAIGKIRNPILKQDLIDSDVDKDLTIELSLDF